MISLIAAIGKNRELGKDNKLLWHLPVDLKRFKELTNGHPIIMGRKTFESIGRVLPNRTNIVITRDPQRAEKKVQNDDNLVVVMSLDEAFDIANKSPGSEEIFVIGGGQIFEQAIKIADRLYLTIVEREYEADTFFPKYDAFSHIANTQESTYDGLRYIFLDLEKPRNT